jgi:mannose-6-phosphate isomerase
MQTYPIKRTYHVRSYYFGERLIPELLGKKDAPEGVVAETWEISDYKETTGTLDNGSYRGRTLHELVEEFPDELVGEGWRGPHFPLLIKFLDASHMLPVHLHADDETAREKHGEPHGKTEAWHILWAADDASILAGIKENRWREDLIKAFKAQHYDAVMPCHGIVPGDTVYVPGGILHTFGPDTLILEVQQTSDLGQFVMPFDLYGNRLNEDEWDANIEATLDELKTDFCHAQTLDWYSKTMPKGACSAAPGRTSPWNAGRSRSHTRSPCTRGASSRSRTSVKGRWSWSTRAARRR